MHIIVFVERVQKIADLLVLRLGEFRKLLWNVADFARHYRPAIRREPFGNGGYGCAFANKFCTSRAFWHIVILLMRKYLNFIGTRFNRCTFAVNVCVRMMRLDKADVVEQKFITARRAELSLFEKHANFRRGAIHVVGVNFDDERNFVRGVALEHDVLHDEFFIADARTFVDGALDGILGDAVLLRFFHGGEKPRVGGNIRAAHFGGHGNFADQFAGRAAFFEAGDQSFSMKPLASHSWKTITEQRVNIQPPNQLLPSPIFDWSGIVARLFLRLQLQQLLVSLLRVEQTLRFIGRHLARLDRLGRLRV